MKVGRLLSIVFVIILCQSILNQDCHATNWQFAVAWKNKMLHYLDTDSIEVDANKEEITFLTKAEAPSGYHFIKLVTCNYAERYCKTLKVTAYDDKGNILKSTPSETATSKKEVIPVESAMENILNEALAIKGIKPKR